MKLSNRLSLKAVLTVLAGKVTGTHMKSLSRMTMHTLHLGRTFTGLTAITVITVIS